MIVNSVHIQTKIGQTPGSWVLSEEGHYLFMSRGNNSYYCQRSTVAHRHQTSIHNTPQDGSFYEADFVKRLFRCDNMCASAMTFGIFMFF